MLKKLFTKFKALKSSSEKTSKSADTFSYENFYNLVFSDSAHKNIHKFFILSTLISGSYITGRILENKIEQKFLTSFDKKNTGSPFLSSPKKNLNSIASNDLFKAAGVSIKNNTKKEKVIIPKSLVCKNAQRNTILPLKLMHTIVLQDQIKSVAAVQIRGKKDLLNIRQGEMIKTMARLDIIDPYQLIIKNFNTGECEKMVLKKPSFFKEDKIQVLSPQEGAKLIKKYNGIENDGNHFKIKKSFREKMLSNMSEILTQARAIPLKNPDGSTCYKMVEITPDSVYSKLNIKDNDIICGLNGKKFKNMNQIMNIFGRMRDIDNFELSVKRNGTEQNFDYNFVE